MPDICHLEIITSEGKLKNVIGTRVRIDGGSDADADYKDRRVQFENLVRYTDREGGNIMYHIEYAALNYYHSPISDECLCIGVLFHNVTTGQRDFKYISNFQGVSQSLCKPSN